MYTMQEAAKLALDVQDACNLSGVVKTFAKVLDTIWDEAHKQGRGTDFVNTHPITVLFVSKLESLSMSDYRFAEAYSSCRKMTNADSHS